MQISNSGFIGKRQYFGLAPLPRRRRKRIIVIIIGERGFTRSGSGLIAISPFSSTASNVSPKKAASVGATSQYRNGARNGSPCHIQARHATGVFQRAGHVIRHNIDDQSQTLRFKFSHQSFKSFAPANRRLNLIRIGDIITMR